MAEIKITLRRSPIGRPAKHKKILQGLGLKRASQSVVRKETPEIWGMLNKVPHLVDVEPVPE